MNKAYIKQVNGKALQLKALGDILNA